MKMTVPPAADPQAPLPQRMVQGWNRFWFTPADPLPLGLMRICGGLMLLYTTVAYTPDLQEFFGKDAWLNLPEANEFRHDFPVFLPQMDFSDLPVLPQVDDPEQKAEIQRFVDKWNWDPRHAYAFGN